MILYGIKQYKKCDFNLRRENFIMFLKISQLNGPLQKKIKNHQNIHPKFIHMTLQDGLVKDIY
jgi:hypothetical protein